jgi:hypothetical protein
MAPMEGPQMAKDQKNIEKVVEALAAAGGGR